MAEVISSASNPLVRRVRALGQRKHRRREGAFVVEGPQPVWQAVEAGAEIELLLTAPELLAGSPAARMVAERRAAGTRVVELTGELFARLSERDSPAGLAAIVHGRTLRLDELTIEPGAYFVALHEIANPGNLGTVIRTANAAGAAGVVLLGDTTDPFAPAAVKASMGALFTTPIAHTEDPREFLAWAAAGGVHVVTTSGRAERDCWHADLPLPLALLLGSEGEGLPDELLRPAEGGPDRSVRIPMTGTAESLNLAVAAGILLYEVKRRLDAPGD
jgi:TrmH family RNA methyltransferase